MTKNSAYLFKKVSFIDSRNYANYSYILLFLAFLSRLIFLYIFKGESDPWNAESFTEYLLDGQIPFGMPYFPTNMLLGYIFNCFVDSFGLFYSLWMRLGNIFADIGIVVLLFKIAKKMNKADGFSLFVCVAYILNPISFQLTALHGQFDQFVFFFVLLAVYVEMSSSWAGNNKAITSALALVLASYIKPYVVLFFPIFFFKRNSSKEKILFFLTYVIGCILAFALLLDPLLIVRAIRSIVTYGGGGHLGWGISISELPVIGDLVNIYAKFTKPIIIACAVVLGYIGRKQNILLLLLIITLLIYILCPGLASQYLYWAIPIGVIFIDKFFCLYSVLGFIWQLNFFQYLVVERNWYGNYHQFVPVKSIGAFYNFWLYPEQFIKPFHFVMGGVIIPALIIIWLISLLKKYDFRLYISKNTFGGFWKSIFGTKRFNRSVALRQTSAGNLALLVILIVLVAGWLIYFGIVFSRVERYPLWRELKNVLLHKSEKNKNLIDLSKSYFSATETPRHYPRNIKFEGKKVDQYFMHGRNSELIEKLKIDKPRNYFIRVSTSELYKVYVNGNFVEFNWAPDYNKTFGTNRKYKKEFPIIDITKFLQADLNEIRVVANFSFEKPGRNYIAFEIMDEYSNIVFSKRKDLPLIPEKPFYMSLPLILSMLSFLYLVAFPRMVKKQQF